VPEFPTAAHAVAFLLARVSRRAAQFGAIADTYGPNLTYADSAGIERLRAAVIGEQKWLEATVKVLGVVIQAAAAAQDDLAGVINRVGLALSMSVTNVLDRHPQIGEGFRDELEAEFRKVVAV
jgi:hypothetical protein